MRHAQATGVQLRLVKEAMSLGAVLVALFLVVPPRAGEAQPSVKTVRIGYLSPLSVGADTPRREAFRQGLRALGYVEGQNAVIEARYADGKFEQAARSCRGDRSTQKST